MPETDSKQGATRRGVLRAGGAAVGGALLGRTIPRVAAQSAPDFGGWFEGVNNYDGVVDKRGQSEVTVEVGVPNGPGPYGFGPPAVRVDPGTTIVWKWTGKGGSHNVVDKNGDFKSELTGTKGHTFTHTFDTKGVHKYYCAPHKALGMKGAIVVGDAAPSGGGSGGGGGGGQLGPVNYQGWFEGVNNFDGTVDKRGQSEVTVEVGVPNGPGPYGFGPPAVRVDPGTTIVWKWTGKGGSHNVVDKNGDFKSKLVSEAGHTFTHTFDTKGIHKYYCAPHRALGMKGAIVVGDTTGPAGGGDGGNGGGSGGGGGGGAGTPSQKGGGLVPVPTEFRGLFGYSIFGFLALVATVLLGGEAFASIRDTKRAEAAATDEHATESPAEEPAVEITDDYDPIGTATLVAGYFVLIVLLWIFMYFVEFLGAPSITG